MLLSSNEIYNLLNVSPYSTDDPLVIAPAPDLDKLKSSFTASIDLRLGTWFVSMKARRANVLDIYSEDNDNQYDKSLGEKHYTPFGGKFILHPRTFVLAVTLEWVRVPVSLAGIVAGKSSWGRRGLIVETAPGIHPGFTGCLTLEMTNLGEVPIAISPGMTICQLFFHRLEPVKGALSVGSFMGQRQPKIGSIIPDEFATKLMGVK